MKVIDTYLNSSVSMPRSLLQFMIDAYMVTPDCWERFSGRIPSSSPETEGVIAEKSDRLMDVHYNMPLGLFENFLGDYLKYSMALWERRAQTLEDAQRDMLEDMREKAKISGHLKILDIGCGFR